MKKGFTLIELLAVIVILAIIALIATPIVLDIIEETRENANKRSIELYAESIENAIVRYQIKENKKAKSYEDIKDYIEYSGAKVECDVFRIYDDSTYYLNDCKVNNILVKNYSYGTIIGKGTLAYDIVSKYGGKNKITSITDFTVASTGLYKAEDDLGISYYFRGNITDNYVQFGIWEKSSNSPYIAVGPWTEYYDTLEECLVSELSIQYGVSCQKILSESGDPMYWRIVRINGDGTIRLMYIGDNPEGNSFGIDGELWGVSGSKHQDFIRRSFQSNLETWYTNNIELNYGQFVADSGFCNDNDISSQEMPECPEPNLCSENIFYSTYDRLPNNPTYNCSEKNKINVSNGGLNKPVGLITADEVIYSGGALSAKHVFSVTMNNSFVDGLYPDMLYIYVIYNGNLTFEREDYYPFKLYPVINLKADVEFIGSGTINDPYVIVTE